jgi:hypothetical protein
MMERITGQVIVRETGKHHLEHRRLVMVVGILAVPEGFLQGECQYTISGMTIENELAQLTLDQRSKVDVRETTVGNDLGGIICSPIWRVST